MCRIVKRRNRGFTLIELAVVIVIIGILLAVVLTPLSVRIQAQQFQDQERQLREIKDALIGYAQTQGRLPCPDTGNDGIEDACGTPAVGTLPFGTLGIGATDRWGRRYVYAVTPGLTVAAQTGQPTGNAGVDLGDLGAINLLTKDTDKTTTFIADAITVGVDSGAAAIIISLGANGFGGTNADGDTLTAPTGADELENTDGDATFVTRIRTGGAGTCDDTAAAANFCEFDDVVSLIPTPLLLGKMVQAGQLP